MAQSGLPLESLSQTATRRTELVNIGHRGASAYAPEHTVAAYDLALAQGAHYLELDVHLTVDGRIVVMHDESPHRTGRPTEVGAKGSLRAMSWQQLTSLDFGSWFNERNRSFRDDGFVGLKALSLEDVLERYRHMAKFCIEIKPRDRCGLIETRLLAILAHYGLDRTRNGEWRVLIMSGSSTQLETIRSLHAYLPLVHLFGKRDSSAVIRDRLAEIAPTASAIAPPREAVDAALIAAAHGLGLAVAPYTVNDPREMRRLLAIGVDGLITDFPDRLDALLWTRARISGAEGSSQSTGA